MFTKSNKSVNVYKMQHICDFIIISIFILWIVPIACQNRRQLCQSWCIAKCLARNGYNNQNQFCRLSCTNFAICDQKNASCLNNCGQPPDDAPKLLPPIQSENFSLYYVGEPEDSTERPDPYRLRASWDSIPGAVLYVIQFKNATNVVTKVLNAGTTSYFFNKSQICAPVGVQITYVSVDGISETSERKNRTAASIKYAGDTSGAIKLDSFWMGEDVVQITFRFDLPPGWSREEIENINLVSPASEEFVANVDFNSTSNRFMLILKREYFMIKMNSPVYILIKSMDSVCGTSSFFDIQFGYWMQSDCIYKRRVYKDYPQLWTECVADNYRCDMLFNSTDDYSSVNGTSCVDAGMRAEINVSWASRFDTNEQVLWFYELLEWTGGEKDTLDRSKMNQSAKKIINVTEVNLDLTPGKRYYMLACEIFNPYLTLDSMHIPLQSSSIKEFQPLMCDASENNSTLDNYEFILERKNNNLRRTTLICKCSVSIGLFCRVSWEDLGLPTWQSSSEIPKSRHVITKDIYKTNNSTIHHCYRIVYFIQHPFSYKSVELVGLRRNSSVSIEALETIAPTSTTTAPITTTTKTPTPAKTTTTTTTTTTTSTSTATTAYGVTSSSTLPKQFAIPLYRIRNCAGKNSHGNYLTTKKPRTMITATYHIYSPFGPAPNTVPLYAYIKHFVKPNIIHDHHFYTTNPNEIGAIEKGKVGKHGYIFQEIVGYCFQNSGPDSEPLYLGRIPGRHSLFYSTSLEEITGKKNIKNPRIVCHLPKY